MSHTLPWSPAPPRDHNECLARFKPCQEIRASSPSAIPITTASPAAAPSVVKDSRAVASPVGGGATVTSKIPPFRSSPPSHPLPTANVHPFFQDFSKGSSTVGKAPALILESSATPLKNACPIFQDPCPKTPATLIVPPLLGDSPSASPTRGAPAFSQPPAILPFFQEASPARRGTSSSSSFSTPTPSRSPSLSPFRELTGVARVGCATSSTPTACITSSKTCGSFWSASRAAAPIAEEDPAVLAEAAECGEEAFGEDPTHSISCRSRSPSTTGRSQSKSGYSRMMEDPLGDRHAIPLYNRLHFSTVPRKAVAKKTCGASVDQRAVGDC